MRVPAIVLAVALAAPAPAAGLAPADPVDSTGQNQSAATVPKTGNCPRTTSHFAANASVFQGAPLAPRKLTDLPAATSYMAVYRKIDGCEVPLTMTEYRTGRRP